MPRKLVIDFFAGGGGASEGLAQALGRGPDVAINHDSEALAMHKANHPDTTHVLEDVFLADLRKLVGQRKVGMAWFSPDCRDFSRAKGGKPVSKGVRSLPWIVVKAAFQIKPDVIILENVREFAEWGPLIPRWACRACDWKGTDEQIAQRKSKPHCPRCDSRKVSPTEDMVRDPQRLGLTFKRWIGRLRNMGYEVQYKTLDAADFGAPTHRKRLFLIARRDGKPIVWPEPTHADPKKLDRYALFERPKPYRTAAEIIDWELPCLSIFATPEEARAWAKEHKRGIPQRPLKENTLRRIALGIKRYVLEAANPFIVRCDHGGDHFRGQPLDRPLSTVACDHGFGVVTPFVAKYYGGVVGHPVDRPIGTVTAWDHHAMVAPYVTPITRPGGDRQSHPASEPLPTITTAKRGEFAVVAPTLMPHYGNSIAASVDAPLGTVVAGGGGKQALVATTLIQTGYGEREGQAPRVPGLDKPLGTVVSGGQKHGMVAAMLTRFNGQKADESRCHDPTEPLRTVDTSNRFGVASAHLVKFRGDSDGQSIERPVPTITSGAGAARPAGAAHALGLAATCLARFNHGDKQWNSVDEPLGVVTTQGNKFGVVYAFLTKYFGTAIGQSVKSPLGTITQRARYGLVMVEVTPGNAEPAIAVDVPGVGPCIIADIALRMLRPRELARAQGFRDSYILTGPTDCQVAKIGNSVPPVMAKVLAQANYRPAKLVV